MTKIEKDFHMFIFMAAAIKGLVNEALVNVDNHTKAGRRMVRDARDNLMTVKTMIEDTLEVMSAHIAENESRLGSHTYVGDGTPRNRDNGPKICYE